MKAPALAITIALLSSGAAVASDKTDAMAAVDKGLVTMSLKKGSTGWQITSWAWADL